MNLNRIQTIDVIKGIAMFSVICAHCNTVPTNTSNVVLFQSALISNFGTCGTIILFVISGYLYHGDNLRYVFKKKIKIIPAWVFAGTCVYFYVYLRKPPISINSYLYFLIGNGSYLYYLSVLFIFYVLFSFRVMKKFISLMICILAGFVYTMLPETTKTISFSFYLIPFHWIQYFAFGLLLQNTKIHSHISNISRIKYAKLWIPFMFLLVTIILSGKGVRILYWGGYYPIVGILGAGAVVLLSKYISDRVIIPKKIGRKSLFVYLWHMPIAGIVANIMNIGKLQYFVLFRPFIVYGIMYLTILIIETVVMKLNSKLLKTIMGLN